MPLLAAAVCPHPPLLVPEVAAGAAAELDELRAACTEAIAYLLAVAPRYLVVVGSGPATQPYPNPLRGSFARYGVPVEFQLGAGTAAGPALPLGLTVGAWLLYRSGTGVAVRAEAIAGDATVEECVAVGQRYARAPEPVSLLVMGDGTACRGEQAPGYADPRAEQFDASVTKALADADAATLLRLDQRLATELRVAGRAPWQVLAGAAADRAWRGEVLYDVAPYGVNYTVAVWRRAAMGAV